jgi:phospholipase C
MSVKALGGGLMAAMLLIASFATIARLALGTADAKAASFQHVIVIVQENRTPDNLFQGLCAPPFGSPGACSTKPGTGQYNIQTGSWMDKTSPGGAIQPEAIPLNNTYDLSHAHSAWIAQCDADGSGACRMDGAAGVRCGPPPKCAAHPQFRYADNTKGLLNPYLQLATQYAWANYMFQTNAGPSFPAHQFLFGGTSAPNAGADAKGIFASENMTGKSIGGLAKVAGCAARATTRVQLIDSSGRETQGIYPCFEHRTMSDLFKGAVTWRYYSPKPGSIWTAPNAIKHICQSTGPGGTCAGSAWTQHVDFGPSDVLNDIAACKLRSVSWVIPTGANSDHARVNDGGGPSWVASVVNAIGNSTKCDQGGGYWKDTVIIITWDDWGGWYDHEQPTVLAAPQGGYQYGFRVPLVVVSAYTPKNYINNSRHDFGSILRFIEGNFRLGQGALNFADKRSKTDFRLFFDMSAQPRDFQNIDAPKNADFFKRDKRKASDPDDD